MFSIVFIKRCENILPTFRDSALGEEDQSDSSFGDFPATLEPPLTSNSPPASDVERKSNRKLNQTNTDESSTVSMG